MARLGSSLSFETEALSQVVALMEAFRAFDGDDDGQITSAELGGVLRSLGYNASPEEVAAMMQQADKNRDGLLSIEEFLDMNTKNMDLGELSGFLGEAIGMIHSVDAVTGPELYEAVISSGTELSPEDCAGIIASMDGDGDGAVDFADFQLIVNSLLRRES